MSELIKACRAVIEARERRENGRLQQMDFDLLAYDHASQIAKACLVMREALVASEKRLSHIEDWHRDYVTPNNFKDCQDIGSTPEAYLRAVKLECREALSEADSLINKGGNDGKDT